MRFLVLVLLLSILASVSFAAVVKPEIQFGTLVESSTIEIGKRDMASVLSVPIREKGTIRTKARKWFGLFPPSLSPSFSPLLCAFAMRSCVYMMCADV